MESLHRKITEARGLARLAVRMFACPSGRLGRLGGRMMRRRSGPGYDWVMEVLDPTADDRLLDVGCGPGGMLQAARKRTSDVVGVDPSPVMVEMAATSGAEVHRASVERLPFNDGRFTLVCAMHTIDFWPSIEKGLAEIVRVLTPGGRVGIVIRRFDPHSRPWEPARHGYDEPRLDELTEAMRSSGFHHVDRHDGAPGGERLIALLGATADTASP